MSICSLATLLFSRWFLHKHLEIGLSLGEIKNRRGLLRVRDVMFQGYSRAIDALGRSDSVISKKARASIISTMVSGGTLGYRDKIDSFCWHHRRNVVSPEVESCKASQLADMKAVSTVTFSAIDGFWVLFPRVV
jgi:hypothetical protein